MSVLYLHMGIPKTATTSLQMFCTENQEVLNKKGYSYPVLDFVFPHVAARRNGHFMVGRLYDSVGERDIAREEEVWNMGLNMVHEEFKKYPNVILSDENIWNASRGEKFAQWERLKEDAQKNDYQIKAVVYLRRQDTFINSWLAQQIKEGWNTNACIKWDSFIKKPRNQELDYYKHLEKIADVIGRENIIVRVFEREQFQGKGNTIFSDFLDAIGLEFTDEYQIGEAEANKSLTANSQEISRVINSVVPDNAELRDMVRNAAFVCEETKDPENSFVMLSKEETRKFLSNYEEGNQAIAKEYMGREDGFLFSDKIKEGTRWTKQNKFMEEDIIRFFGTLVMEQQQQIQELQKELSLIKESQNNVVKNYLKNHESDDVDELDSKEKDLLATAQMVFSRTEEFKNAVDKVDKFSDLEDKHVLLSRQVQSIKNEIYDVNTRISEQNNRTKVFQKKTREQIRDLQQTALLFRLRRKTQHILGKDKVSDKE